jgi:tRNA A37 threonylcarbamoyladenosine biosynthesis protein TsaE
MTEIILHDINETRAWAADFANKLFGRDTLPACPENKRMRRHTLVWKRVPTCIALHGDLGMGKSEIARAIIQTLCGADTIVPSPTFTLVQGYYIAPTTAAIPAAEPPLSGGAQISHFDLYRVSDVSELEEIGLPHAIANDITLIEWPEIAANLLPENTIHIYIKEFEGGRKLVYPPC